VCNQETATSTKAGVGGWSTQRASQVTDTDSDLEGVTHLQKCNLAKVIGGLERVDHRRLVLLLDRHLALTLPHSTVSTTENICGNTKGNETAQQ
jgi:hypothetical protein